MLEKLEHIGIAVGNETEAVALYTALLGFGPYKTEEVPSEGVKTIFFELGETKLELLAASNPDTAVGKFLAQRGEGVHHLAFRVSDIRAEMDRLKAAGFELLTSEPRPGADNKLICFLHPRSTRRVLVELCQEIHQT